MLTFCLTTLLSLTTFRLIVRLSLWGLRHRGYNYRHIVLIGANDRTAHLAEVILSHEQYGYHIEGFLEDDEERKSYLERYNIPI